MDVDVSNRASRPVFKRVEKLSMEQCLTLQVEERTIMNPDISADSAFQERREFPLNESVKITPARMILLGTGWFGFQVFWAFHASSMPLFLRDLTESKFTISLVLSLVGVAGCIIPPVIGYFSDHSSGRFGRRRPYIFFGTLGVLLCVLCLPHMTTLGIVALISGLMYFSIRCAETPYLSLLPDITPQDQRSTASGVMNLFGSIGLISCFAVSSLIWEKHPTAVFCMVAFGLFCPVLITITIIREPQAPQQQPAKGSNPLNYLKELAKETNVLKFFIAQFFWWFGFWMVSTFAALFVAEELKVAEAKAFLVLMTFSLVATVFMLPLGMLGDRLGRKGILSCLIIFWAVSEVVVGFSQNLTHALITVGLTAIPFAGVMGIGLAYFLDLTFESCCLLIHEGASTGSAFAILLVVLNTHNVVVWFHFYTNVFGVLSTHLKYGLHVWMKNAYSLSHRPEVILKCYIQKLANQLTTCPGYAHAPDFVLRNMLIEFFQELIRGLNGHTFYAGIIGNQNGSSI